jgi:hypothetical protein
MATVTFMFCHVLVPFRICAKFGFVFPCEFCVERLYVVGFVFARRVRVGGLAFWLLRLVRVVYCCCIRCRVCLVAFVGNVRFLTICWDGEFGRLGIHCLIVVTFWHCVVTIILKIDRRVRTNFGAFNFCMKTLLNIIFQCLLYFAFVLGCADPPTP